MTVLVVGGGVAGMVAARELALGGETVTLLEAGDRLGGSVASLTVAGIILDAGAESFATRTDAVAVLATDLGLADALVDPDPEGAWLRRDGGTTVPLPSTSLLGIPGVPLASDVVSVVGRRAAWRAMLDLLIPGIVGSRAQTLGTLVARRMGTGVLHGLVAPVTEGIHSRHPDELLVDRVAPALRQALLREGSLQRAVRDLRAPGRAGSAVRGLRGGMNRLVEELAADLRHLGVEVRLGTRVLAVREGAVELEGPTGGVLEGRVLVAAPHVPGATTTPAGPDEQVSVVMLVVDDPRLDAHPRGTGVLVAAGDTGVTARALTHSSAKWPWLAATLPPGRHVLRLSYDGATAPADLAPVAHADASVLLGVDLPEPIAFARADWRRPAPQGDAAPGIHLTGEASSGTGLAAVVAHATRTARELLADPLVAP